MALLSMLPFVSTAILLVAVPTASAASITGIVKDTAGKPLEKARVDYTAMRIVVAADEIRTDSDGRFRVVTESPAIVIRKPGYESQRVRINGNAQLEITLLRIRSTSRCKLSVQPVFKTKKANDIDYVATWFYVDTENGPQGIISGHGPFYSGGTPDSEQVWKSVEYTEIMYENGIIDASGRSADGKYWRLRSILGAASQYYDQTRDTAKQLDCVMDHVPLESK